MSSKDYTAPASLQLVTLLKSLPAGSTSLLKQFNLCTLNYLIKASIVQDPLFRWEVVLSVILLDMWRLLLCVVSILFQCPTSLLSMVDTSVGGKTSIDLPQGKNIIGVYKQPSKIIADVATLQTLTKVDFASGMAEMVKYGLLVESQLVGTIRARIFGNKRELNPLKYGRIAETCRTSDPGENKYCCRQILSNKGCAPYSI